MPTSRPDSCERGGRSENRSMRNGRSRRGYGYRGTAAARKRRPVSNFDLQIETRQGRKWCNVSVLMVQEAESTSPYCIHIVRPIDVPKRLELLMRDFIVTETGLPPKSARRLGSLRRIPTGEAELTKRQGEILRLLVKGATTASIAAELHISRTTVNNHVQQILHKLNAHTRLEAIRRAERSGPRL